MSIASNKIVNDITELVDCIQAPIETKKVLIRGFANIVIRGIKLGGIRHNLHNELTDSMSEME